MYKKVGKFSFTQQIIFLGLVSSISLIQRIDHKRILIGTIILKIQILGSPFYFSDPTKKTLIGGNSYLMMLPVDLQGPAKKGIKARN